MAEEKKVELEREYIINVRKEILKVPRYRRAKKALRAIKEFLAKHMKVEKRDIKKVKIDKYLNEEIWHRGIKKPLTKIKVKAKKIEGVVYAELAEIPEVIKFKKEKEERFKQQKKVEEKKEAKKEEKESEKEKKEEKEKEAATIESNLKKQEEEAKKARHEIKGAHKEKVQPRRMALKK
ncbi:MAG: 50S ribosomal protein L31e [Candidatus Pacearchaeota archaeon]